MNDYGNRVIGTRESRPLEKVEDRDGYVAITRTHLARRLEIATLLLRMSREIFGRMAAHEGKAQRPCGLAGCRATWKLMAYIIRTFVLA